MLKILTNAMAVIFSIAVTPTLWAQNSELEAYEAFLSDLEPSSPGLAVVVVSSEGARLTYINGYKRASQQSPLTPETPLYIASQTKAFVGLVAAALDAQGILPLDSAVTEYWPDLDLPGPQTPSQWTLSDLLSHQFPWRAPSVAVHEAFVGEIDPKDYPRLLESFAQPRDPGFRYSNLGYNIYTAILEAHTGKSWQVWLDEIVFDPMGMARSSARTSDFEQDDIAWSHVWLNDEEGWYEIAPKADSIMQSAGGLVVSPHDMSIWLQAQLQALQGQETALPSDILVQPFQALAPIEPDETATMPCTGYGLGWGECSYKGTRVFQHGGGYTGSRSFMAIAPELDLAIAVFANSNRDTAWLRRTLVYQLLDEYLAPDEARALSESRRTEQGERLASFEQQRAQQEAQRRQDERWHGWSWTPEPTTICNYAGAYTTGEPYLDLDIECRAQALHLVWGEYHMPLEPAANHLFAGREAPYQGLEAVEFIVSEEGRVTGLNYDGHHYRRSDIE